MSTSTVTRTASTSSDTSLGDWLEEEEGVVVKDEETLTDSSLSPTVESVIVDPFETLIQDSLHKLITSLLTKFETEVLVVISVLAVLSLLFTSVRKRVLRLVGCGRRPLQQPPQEDNKVEEEEEEEEEICCHSIRSVNSSNRKPDLSDIVTVIAEGKDVETQRLTHSRKEQ